MIKTRTRFVFGDGPSEHRGTTRADPSRDAKAKGVVYGHWRIHPLLEIVDK